jgi:hypothetical protein
MAGKMKIYENEVSERSSTINKALQYRLASGFDAFMKINHVLYRVVLRRRLTNCLQNMQSKVGPNQVLAIEQ